MALTLLKRLIKGSRLTHAEGDNNLALIEEAVNAKAEASHVHTIANVTGLQEALDEIETDLGEKAETTHVHAIAGITGLQDELDSKMALADKGFGRIVAMGRTQLTDGTSVSLVDSNWRQDGGANCQLIVSYDRNDALGDNAGVLYPANTTSNNTTFIIKSTNITDNHWVVWAIVKAY